jgi:hypothetical protein
VGNITSARDLIKLVRGSTIITAPQESDVTVATTAVKLGSYANTRVAITLSNTGTLTIAVGFSNAVTLTTGIVLTASGSIAINWVNDGELVMSDIWAISSGAGSTVHVVESGLRGM